MLMGSHGLALLETAYFDNNDSLAHDLLVHMYGVDHLEERRERWNEWPKYASRKRLEAQEAHKKYQPIP
jgi:hypothetical protein